MTGQATENAFIESFNGKFRAECLNAHWFMSSTMRGENAAASQRDRQ
jgi:putative transposase